jgi:glycosyltransferase involved in cell wall biosynthesis
MAPAVSVVIPTHNRRGLLPIAIRSVLVQTFQDFEVLVVDDASTDATIDLRREFCDSRLRWLQHDTPRGGAAARNTGIVHSRGEYIAFLDDDDEWYPTKLARQMDVILNSPRQVGAVYTGYRIVDRASGAVRERITPSRRGDLHADLLASNPIGGASSVLVRRACLDKVGLFDERLPSLQDRDLWIRIARQFHFDYVEEPLLNYCAHPTRVWTDLEALTTGLERMLEKYGSSPAFRRYSSRRYLEFGVRLCRTAQIRAGRRALLKSIALDPFRVKAYLFVLLTLLGGRTFAAVRDVTAKLLPHGNHVRANVDAR